MSVVLTIDGVDRSELLEAATLQIRDALGSRSTLRCVVGGDKADAAAYVPDDDDLVVVTRAGQPAFGGYVLLPTRGGVGNMSLVTIDATDYNVVADDRHVTVNLPAGLTLKQVIAALAPYLPAAIVIDPAMPDGPVIAVPLTWTDVKLSQVWTDIGILTNGEWGPRIGHDAVLRLLHYGTELAPWSVSDAQPNLIEHPTVRPRRDAFANRVLLKYGSGDVWTAEQQAADGVTRTFPVQHPVALKPPHVSIDGLPYPLFDLGDPFAGEWTWDPAAGDHGAIVQDPAYPALTAPHVVSWEYSARYPDTAIAEDAADIAARDRAIEWQAPAISEVISKAQAEAMAAGYLAMRMVRAREFIGKTDQPGLAPGQTISIQWTPRGIPVATDFLITDVSYREIAGDDGEWTFTAIEGSAYTGGKLDIFRAWNGGSAGGGGSVTAAPPAVITAPTVPVYLGGSREASRPLSAGVWTPVIDYIPYDAQASYAGRVKADLWARQAGVGVTARLYNVTDGTAVESAQVTATVPTAVTFDVSIVAGKTYRLDVVVAADGSAYAIGTLRSI